MLIAHLPAGYLLSKGMLAMEHLHHLSAQTKRRLVVAGMAGAIFPDIDLLYFYLIDHRQHGHHSYWTHLPLFWVIAMMIWIALFWQRSRAWAWLGIVFGISALDAIFPLSACSCGAVLVGNEFRVALDILT